MAERGRALGVMRLELRDVWAAPAGAPQPVLRGLSLSLSSGEWVTVGGANGCGKSTLLQVAAGLLAPHRGVRRVGFDSGRRPPRIATVLQDPSVQLFAPTVAGEIALTALHLGIERERREAAIERWSRCFGLEAELDREPHTLSAGQQQLVLLAAALACDPDLLVADEPCAHLDAAARGRVVAALERARSEGLAILWATQSRDEQSRAGRPCRITESGVLTDAARLEGEAREAEFPGPVRASAEGPLVRIEVGPETGELRGPRVRTPRSFVLPLPRRGIVCLEGPNGVGKSALLAAACGLLESPQLRVTREAEASPPLLVGQFPETQIFEDEVGRELIFAAAARGVGSAEALRQARTALEGFELGPRLTPERHTWELSTGERRLVLLIAALTAPASLLAFDEPTAGLDADRKAGLARLIVRRSESGLVLIASQDVPWVASLPAVRASLPPPEMPSSPSEKTD